LQSLRNARLNMLSGAARAAGDQSTRHVTDASSAPTRSSRFRLMDRLA
jgi:hypothetical protein